jgi:uncharacterized protein (DUF1697 family)
MPLQYVALLRAISNVAMAPFRTAVEALGFTEVASYGMSGNLMFNTARTDATGLERDIAARVGAMTMVRTRSEMRRIVARDPLAGAPGASVLFLARRPTAERRRALRDLEVEGNKPVLVGRTVYFRYPLLRAGKNAPVDLEKVLGVKGTIRSAGVVRALLARMTSAG